MSLLAHEERVGNRGDSVLDFAQEHHLDLMGNRDGRAHSGSSSIARSLVVRTTSAQLLRNVVFLSQISKERRFKVVACLPFQPSWSSLQRRVQHGFFSFLQCLSLWHLYHEIGWFQFPVVLSPSSTVNVSVHV